MVSSLQLDPKVIHDIQSLEWIARTLAKGLLLGRHGSAKLGTGMEFTQYRPYTQGDDLRMLDWHMYAKTGKYFIRQSTIESNHGLNIHLDDSPSMTYEEDGFSKLSIAKIIAATLTYVMMNQGDVFGWDSNNMAYVKGQSLKDWYQSLNLLFQLQGSASTQSQDTINHKPGIHLWITDLYDTQENIEKYLKGLMLPNQEIILLYIIGQREEILDFQNGATFLDLESHEEIQVNVQSYQSSYQELLGQHLLNIQRFCLKQGIAYHKVYLQDNITQVLRQLIHQYNHLSAL